MGDMFNIFNKKYKSIVRLANKKRDAKCWDEASKLYGQAISLIGLNKDSFRYLVQQGNCLKEAGKFDQSLEVYQKASNISDDDSDLHLQMGHRGFLL